VSARARPTHICEPKKKRKSRLISSPALHRYYHHHDYHLLLLSSPLLPLLGPWIKRYEPHFSRATSPTSTLQCMTRRCSRFYLFLAISIYFSIYFYLFLSISLSISIYFSSDITNVYVAVHDSSVFKVLFIYLYLVYLSYVSILSILS
jgi:hypothetical protein